MEMRSAGELGTSSQETYVERERLRDRLAGSGDEELDRRRSSRSLRLSRRFSVRLSFLLGILKEEDGVRVFVSRFSVFVFGFRLQVFVFSS